ASAARATPEDVAEDVREGGEDVADVGEPAAESRAAGALVTEAVVERPFLRVGEHLVGLRGFLEARLRLMVAGVAVGVQLEGELAVGPLQLAGIGAARDTQDLVIIALRAHGNLAVEGDLASVTESTPSWETRIALEGRSRLSEPEEDWILPAMSRTVITLSL